MNSEMSMERSLSKITIFYQVSGIQCFSINAESLKTTSGLSRKHKLFLVMNFSFLIVELCGVLFRLLLEKQKQEKQHHKGLFTGLIVQFLTYIFLILVFLISLLNSLFLREKSKKIFRNCQQISDILSVLSQNADYSAFQNELKKTIIKLSFGYVTSITTLLIFAYHFSVTTFLATFVTVYPYLFMTIVFSYWTLLVRLIRENLRFVKECVVHLYKKHSLFRMNPERCSHDLRIRWNQETYNFIMKLKKIYGIIFDTTALINELIAMPICVFLIFIVLSNISGGYKIFLSSRGVIPVAEIGGDYKNKNERTLLLVISI